MDKNRSYLSFSLTIAAFNSHITIHKFNYSITKWARPISGAASLSYYSVRGGRMVADGGGGGAREFGSSVVFAQ